MNPVLGISAFYHDSSAALVVDGRIAAAAHEERFTREKHDSGFPVNAVRYCLEEAGIKPGDLGAVAFYEKPLLKFERLLETYLAFAPRGAMSFAKAMPLWLGQKLFVPREIDKGLDNAYSGPIYFVSHHDSHAASAFFASPFEKSAIITADGVGEWSTMCWGTGEGGGLELRKEIRFPDSAGLLYSAFTYYTGFRVNAGEYKLMGLAPYGQPVYKDLIMRELIDVRDDGSFRLDQRYFNYCAGLTMTSRRFHELFGGPPRRPGSRITTKDMDLAASVQNVLEEIMLRVCRHVHAETGMKNLSMAGGVGLNAVSNGRLLRESPFDEIFIQPASGDAGGALGAALYAWHQVSGMPRRAVRPDLMEGSLLGPGFSPGAVRSYLDSIGAVYTSCGDEAELCGKVAGLIASGKIVGHFHGRMEYGPRALGNRSILGDARDPGTLERINALVKFRESFRPLAPSCLEEKAGEYFEIDRPSPYMLMVVPVRKECRRQLTAEELGLEGVDRIRAVRSDIPAVTHVDYSARVQTVSQETSPRFYGIISAFERMTGCAVLVNTSFNVRGEPIVCSPEDAYRCFMSTGIDALVLEDCLLMKEDQPETGPAQRG